MACKAWSWSNPQMRRLSSWQHERRKLPRTNSLKYPLFFLFPDVTHWHNGISAREMHVGSHGYGGIWHAKGWAGWAIAAMSAAQAWNALCAPTLPLKAGCLGDPDHFVTGHSREARTIFYDGSGTRQRLVRNPFDGEISVVNCDFEFSIMLWSTSNTTSPRFHILLCEVIVNFLSMLSHVQHSSKILENSQYT